jgi:hypothetical protein
MEAEGGVTGTAAVFARHNGNDGIFLRRKTPYRNVIRLSKLSACAKAKQPILALPAAQSGRHGLHPSPTSHSGGNFHA